MHNPRPLDLGPADLRAAGILDPCGVAGGALQYMDGREELFGIVYQNTTNAKHGDRGAQLPRRDTGTVWTAGDVVEVSWTLNANHGGGNYKDSFSTRLSHLTQFLLICFLRL